MQIKKRSCVFSFEGKPVEYSCGLVVDETAGIAIISYGVFDKRAVIILLPLDEIGSLLEFEVNAENPIARVAIDETVPISDALKCVAAHEDQIWRLIDELLAAQTRIDVLVSNIAKDSVPSLENFVPEENSATESGSRPGEAPT